MRPRWRANIDKRRRCFEGARGRRGDTAIPFSGRGRIYVEFGYLDDTTLSYCGYHRRVLARYRGCGALDDGDRHGRRRVAHGFRKERYRPARSEEHTSELQSLRHL